MVSIHYNHLTLWKWRIVHFKRDCQVKVTQFCGAFYTLKQLWQGRKILELGYQKMFEANFFNNFGGQLLEC